MSPKRRHCHTKGSNSCEPTRLEANGQEEGSRQLSKNGQQQGNVCSQTQEVHELHRLTAVQTSHVAVQFGQSMGHHEQSKPQAKQKQAGVMHQTMAMVVLHGLQSCGHLQGFLGIHQSAADTDVFQFDLLLVCTGQNHLAFHGN